MFSPADAAPLMSQEFAEMNPSSGFVTFIRWTMTIRIVNEVLLFSCLLAFVTGIVLAATTLLG